MKKRIFVFATVLFLLFLVGCRENSTENDDLTSTPVSTLTTIEHPTYREIDATFPPYSIVDSVTPFSVWGGEYPDHGGHRSIYYGIEYRFIDLVNREEANEWELEKRPEFNDFNEMAVVQFIKRFNISREEFDKVNQILIDEVKNDPRNSWAPYNADLIYTFDPIKISNYYRQYDEKGNEIRWRELEPWKELLKP